jgi:8-oxo-dGTP pyrophosphatase MutT (NUDIX family)
MMNPDNPFEDMGPDTPPRPPEQQRAVRPRNAATLILLRRDAAEPRVLMGRRNKGHNFMPGKWVFPGGRIDRSDYNAPAVSELRDDVTERLTRGAPPTRARALALAAVRETFEEVGLLLAQRTTKKHKHTGGWSEFLAHGALPDLDAMDFVARAVTPASSPKRFDARFFIADAERLVSLEPEPDCGELDEIVWVTLDEALGLDLPSVTRFVLREIPLRLNDPDRPAPFVKFTHGKSRITHI